MLLLNIEWFRELPTRDKAEAILDNYILPDAVRLGLCFCSSQMYCSGIDNILSRILRIA